MPSTQSQGLNRHVTKCEQLQRGNSDTGMWYTQPSTPKPPFNFVPVVLTCAYDQQPSSSRVQGACMTNLVAERGRWAGWVGGGGRGVRSMWQQEGGG